jgi:ATP-dependent helicase/nuclease subunit A
MTVHQAKGLEWPVVVVPDVGRKHRAESKAVVMSAKHGICARGGRTEKGENQQCEVGALITNVEKRRQTAEERRLLYVAATRARDYLLISAAIAPGKSDTYSSGSWLNWLGEAGGWDFSKPCCPPLSGEDWTMRVVMNEPEPLLQVGARGKSLANLYRSELLSTTAIGDHRLDDRVLRQVRPVALDVTVSDTIAVTAMAQYLQCPHAYYRNFVLDEPFIDEHWGIGRLKSEAPATSIGQFAHVVLALVGREGAEALDRALDAAEQAPEYVGQLSDGERQRVRNWIASYLDSPTYDTLVRQAERLRSEAPIAFMLDGVLITGQVDAIAETSDGRSHVLDFKTGSSNEALATQYRLQIGLYCEALRQAHGRFPDSATLVYLTTGDHEQLCPSITAEDATNRARQIADGIRKGNFGPSVSDACGWCGYRATCPFRRSG